MLRLVTSEETSFRAAQFRRRVTSRRSNLVRINHVGLRGGRDRCHADNEGAEDKRSEYHPTDARSQHDLVKLECRAGRTPFTRNCRAEMQSGHA
jgi:hypothetical protein